MASKDQPVKYGELIQTGSPDSILANLYRKILYGININFGRFDSLISRYMFDKNIPINNKKLSSTRRNLANELMASGQTWKVFVKGLAFLSVDYCDFEVEMTHKSGRITEHFRRFYTDNRKITSNAIPGVVTVSPEMVLSSIFKDARDQLGIDDKIFSEMTVDYIRRSKMLGDASALSNTKGNLKKDFLKPRLSWMFFVKSLVFLNVKRFKITARMHTTGGSNSDHNLEVILDMEDFA